MKCSNSESLGLAWVNLVRMTVQSGVRLGNEGYEVLGVEVAFPAAPELDPVLAQFGDASMMADMQRVFFGHGSDALGHSYADLMQGPGGGRDLQDVISLLRQEPWSKRALVTLAGVPNGKVPCINAILFLVRNGALQTTYFARGQDAFGKFYADGLCLAQMARTVALGLNLPAGTVTGFIASSHVYDRDLPAIRSLLAQTQSLLR